MNFESRPILPPSEEEPQVDASEQAAELEESEVRPESQESNQEQREKLIQAVNEAAQAFLDDEGSLVAWDANELGETAAGKFLDTIKAYVEKTPGLTYVDTAADGVEVVFEGEDGEQFATKITLDEETIPVDTIKRGGRRNAIKEGRATYRFIIREDLKAGGKVAVAITPPSKYRINSTTQFLEDQAQNAQAANQRIENDPEVEEAKHVNAELVEEGEKTISEQRQEYQEKLEQVQKEIFLFSEIISDKITHDAVKNRITQIMMQNVGSGVDVINHPVTVKWNLEMGKMKQKLNEMLTEVGFEGSVPDNSQELTQYMVQHWTESGFSKEEKAAFIKEVNDQMSEKARSKRDEALREIDSDITSSPESIQFERESKEYSKLEVLADAQDIIEKVVQLKARRESEGAGSSTEGILIIEITSLLSRLERGGETESFSDIDFNRDYNEEIERVLADSNFVENLIGQVEAKLGESLTEEEKNSLKAAEVRAQKEAEAAKQEAESQKLSPESQEAEKVANDAIRLVNNIYHITSEIAVLKETLEVIEAQRESFDKGVYDDLHEKYTSDLQRLVERLPVDIQGIRGLEFIDGENLSDDDFAVNIQQEPQTVIRAILEKIDNLDSSGDKVNDFRREKEVSDEGIENLKAQIQEEVGEALQVESQEEVIDGELIESEEETQKVVQDEEIEEDIIDGEWSPVADSTSEIESSDTETAIVLASQFEEVADSIGANLGKEETLAHDSETGSKINQEISDIESDIQAQKEKLGKVDTSEKADVKQEIKDLESKLLEKKREKVRIENTEYINSKLLALDVIKTRLDSVRNGEPIDESGTDLPSDLESLQALYQEEFTKTVNILAGLHMRDEIKNLYKAQFDHMIKDYDEAKAEEESKVVTGFKAVAKKWKSIPAKYKIGLGLGLGMASGGVGAAAVMAGGGLLGMKALTVSSTWVGMDSWTQQKLENGRINEVKAKIESLKKDNSDARSVVELMALATTTRELTGKDVLSQEDLNTILELSAEKFSQKAESDVKIDDENRLAKLKEKIINQEDAPTNSVSVEGQHVYTEISAVTDYKEEQQERLKKNKRAKFINKYVKSGGVALGMAFSGEILMGGVNSAQAMFDSAESGVENAINSVPGVNLEGLSDASPNPGFTEASDLPPVGTEESLRGYIPETPADQIRYPEDLASVVEGSQNSAETFNTLKEQFPGDVRQFSPGDTVSGEIKDVLGSLGAPTDPNMLAQVSYGFLDTEVGRAQLYELAGQTPRGAELLSQYGYTDVASFIEADNLSYDQVMELAKNMETGELVGLETYAQNYIDGNPELIYGADITQAEVSYPLEDNPGTSFNANHELTSIDLSKADISPDSIRAAGQTIGSNVDLDIRPGSLSAVENAKYIIGTCLEDTQLDKISTEYTWSILQEYTLSDTGSQFIYEHVMDNPDAQYLNDIRAMFEKVAEQQGVSVEALADKPDLIKAALAGEGAQGTSNLAQIYGAIHRATADTGVVQFPKFKDTIVEILAKQASTT